MLLEAQGGVFDLIVTSWWGIKLVRILSRNSVKCSTCKLGSVLRRINSVIQSQFEMVLLIGGGGGGGGGGGWTSNI